MGRREIGDARENEARAQELCFMTGLSVEPDLVMQSLHKRRDGGAIEVAGTRFYWGDVERLFPKDPLQVLQPDPTAANRFLAQLEVAPLHVVHVDHLSKNRRTQIERELGLHPKTLSGSLTDIKFDLFVQSKTGQQYFISVKELSASSKLGQVSRRTHYGRATLHGGLRGFSIPTGHVPEEFSCNETDLKAEVFANAKKKNKKKDLAFAYFRKNYGEKWKSQVASTRDEARFQLTKFGAVIQEDRNSLMEFLRRTFAGSLAHSPDFYLALSGEAIQLVRALEKINNPEWTVEICDDSSAKLNPAILVGLRKNHDEPYWITRIEASFDGANAGVSQIKGIIFYFQQYPQSVSRSYKQLLLDIRD